jgi:hypothetical protein
MDILQVQGNTQKFGGGGGHARVLGPLDVAIAQKFTMPHASEKPVGTGNRVILDKVTMIDKSTFELDKELLHGGKGKNNDVIELNYDHTQMGRNTTTRWEGLKSPRLEGTGEAVQGDNRKAMRRENKQRCQILRAEQADKT